MTIYTSPIRTVHITKQSLYTTVFSRKHDPSMIAYIDAPTGRTLSRKDLRDLTLQLAHGVRTQHGLRRGDTALIFSPNSLPWPVLHYGLIAAGVRVSPANSAYTPAELANQYVDCAARLVFVHPDLLPVTLDMFAHIGATRADARSRIVVMCLPGDDLPAAGFASMGELFGRGALPAEEGFDNELADETLYLCYSSGTTGKPKGVEVRRLRCEYPCDMN